MRARSNLYAGPADIAVRNGGRHVGCDFPLRRAGVFRRRDRVHHALRAAVMGGDYILAACVTAGVLAYLVYALIRPEKF
jgi:K+-transporting ATPase KdpF subunit